MKMKPEDTPGSGGIWHTNFYNLKNCLTRQAFKTNKIRFPHEGNGLFLKEISPFVYGGMLCAEKFVSV